MINNESVELFFAGLTDDQMTELIQIFENGDENKLNKYLDKLKCDIPKAQLIEGLSMIKDMKSMFVDFD